MTEKSTAQRQIRKATADDLEALYNICLWTANAGTDATDLYTDPKVPGSIWAAPYGVFEPDLTFVLSEGDEAIGYVLAVRDTADFVAQLEREWWPNVRQQFAHITPRSPTEANALKVIAKPEAPLAYLLEDYPAHLHINILPQAQSGGWGRKLIEHQLAALRAAGVPGVHLGVSPTNERAKGFYRHLGFEDVSRGDNVTFAMKLV